MNKNYQLGLLYLVHLLMSADGVIDENEVQALSDLKIKEGIPDSTFNEFNKAISINPQASYFLNRSICYYKMGNMQKAKEDALIASQRGAVIPDNYKSLLKLK